MGGIDSHYLQFFWKEGWLPHSLTYPSYPPGSVWTGGCLLQPIIPSCLGPGPVPLRLGVTVVGCEFVIF